MVVERMKKINCTSWSNCIVRLSTNTEKRLRSDVKRYFHFSKLNLNGSHLTRYTSTHASQ